MPAYAAFVAAVGMLETHAPKDIQGSRKFLSDHCRESVSEVREQPEPSLGGSAGGCEVGRVCEDPGGAAPNVLGDLDT